MAKYAVIWTEDGLIRRSDVDTAFEAEQLEAEKSLIDPHAYAVRCG